MTDETGRVSLNRRISLTDEADGFVPGWKNYVLLELDEMRAEMPYADTLELRLICDMPAMFTVVTRADADGTAAEGHVMTPQRARDTLDKWGRNNAMRDRVVVSAYRAGISKREIHQRTGIARTTIDRIIARLVPLGSAARAPGRTRRPGRALAVFWRQRISHVRPAAGDGDDQVLITQQRHGFPRGPSGDPVRLE